jgi:hypothetical protein
MATKKKGKKTTKSKRTSNKKVAVKSRPSKISKKKKTPKKQAAAKETGTKKAATKKATTAKKAIGGGRAPRQKLVLRNKRERAAFDLETGPRSGGQSGDLQGLRDTEGADSESVGELIEEGNAFEAGVVSGVEHADDDEPREVHTHEVPEDDVPEEYLDED